MENNTISYAGFWKRFLAHIIDSLLLGFVFSIIFIPFWLLFGLGIFDLGNFNEIEEFVNVSGQKYDDEISIAMYSILFMFVLGVTIFAMLIQWLYFALMESSNKQGTLGKLALGIKVTDMNGNRISFGKATGRTFGKILSGLILNIGYIMAGFTEKKQALHDILANCLVVNSSG